MKGYQPKTSTDNPGYNRRQALRFFVGGGATVALGIDIAVAEPIKPENTLCGYLADSTGNTNGRLDLGSEQITARGCTDSSRVFYVKATIEPESQTLWFGQRPNFGENEQDIRREAICNKCMRLPGTYDGIAEILPGGKLGKVEYFDRATGKWKDASNYHLPHREFMNKRRKK